MKVNNPMRVLLQLPCPSLLGWAKLTVLDSPKSGRPFEKRILVCGLFVGQGTRNGSACHFWKLRRRLRKWDAAIS
jgi:hypothetical protein